MAATNARFAPSKKHVTLFSEHFERPIRKVALSVKKFEWSIVVLIF
jgi:hypothetical protein